MNKTIRSILIVGLLGILLPHPLQAAGGTISRHDGFILLWTPLKRAMEETNEKPFSDIPRDHPSFPLLTFAKGRGILSDDATFYPEEPLRMNDALLWLLRSRNVAPPTDISYETLGAFVSRYALLPDPGSSYEENPMMTQDVLLSLITTLDTALKNEFHEVSFYAEEFEGDGTAFGEKFNPRDLTAAHRTLPYNTLVKVRHPASGKEVTVRINDRGPYVDGRDMDLSLAAFEMLTTRSSGVLRDVTFERLGSVSLVEKCPAPTYQRRLGQVLLSPGIPRSIERGATITLSADAGFRLLQMRAPGMKPVRSETWTARGETLEISFEKLGRYSFVLIGDDGRRRRFQTQVLGDGC
jgi:hypothetical protein